MIPLRVAEIAAVLGAELVGPGDLEAVVTGVTADSRTVQAGALFVALSGERADGHRFVPGAADQGAVAALTSRAVEGALCLVVVDPLVAFGRLARHLVERGRAGGLQVVGITGSQGKTSTKDLLALILESAGPTVAPVGNLNNELGVPLTVTRVEPDTRFLVAEMGARGIGHIAYLCDIAPPSVGVVLNVGHAHVGEFGGQAAIAVAKGELVEALPATGWAVLNADDPLVWAMRSRTAATVVGFGIDAPPPGPAVWASSLVSDSGGHYGFDLHTAGLAEDRPPVPVQLQVVGRHQVANAVAAAAAAYALGLDPAVIAAALSAASTRSRWRMEVHQAARGVLIVNDSYNANPDSMRAALSTAAELGRAGGATWAVLGDMLELGADAEHEHAGIGDFVARAGLDHLVAIGDFAPTMVAAAQAAGMDDAVVVVDKPSAVRTVLAGLGPGDVVLVKASRGLALDTVAEEIATAVGPVEGGEDRT
jgi:UDP-N-acetylmuramoyl-tripeptide--D-alanyl-D-alanine ligase